MYKDVNDFFKKNLKVKVDKNLIQSLKMFRLRWVTKSDEYIEFLGSNLTGVHSIRFSSIDDDLLMNDIMLINDITAFQKEFHTVPDMLKKYKIGSNVIYHTLTYLLRVLLVENKSLSSKLKEEGMFEIALIMQYKMFSSLYFSYFKFNVDVHIAVTVYEKLSYKFILKQLNSWGEVFEYRARYMLNKKSPTYTKLSRYNSEDALRVITDIQTKTRSGLLTIYSVLMKVVNEKQYITGESSTYVGGDHDEKQVKDVGTSINNYITIITQIKYSGSDFIDRDLITIVHDVFDTVDKDIMYEYFKGMTDEKMHRKIRVKIKKYKNDKDPYDHIIKDIMSINFEYLQRLNVNIHDRSNIAKAIVLVKNYWSSSKVKNDDMNNIKRYLYDMSVLITGRRTKWIAVTLAISYILYIFLRSMKKD